MKNNFLLRDEFQEWLINIGQFPSLTAKSYCSYVAGVDKTMIFSTEEALGDKSLSSLLEPSVRKVEFPVAEAIITNVINTLSTVNIEHKLNTPKSYIQNWKSALFQYIEFLDYYIGTRDSIEDTEEDSIEKELTEGLTLDYSDKIFLKVLVNLSNDTTPDFIYTKSDLISNFRFRLHTQDRFYAEVFYPIGFIKRLLYKKGEKEFFNSWLDSLIDDVTVFVKNDSVKLKSVKKLEISGGKILIYVNGSSRIAFTRKSDNTTLMPFSAINLDNVALDHEKPLLKVMHENLDSLKTFLEITKEIKSHISRKITVKKCKKACNLVFHSDFIHQIDLESLKSELKLLASFTHLQLMDGSENKRKGARD